MPNDLVGFQISSELVTPEPLSHLPHSATNSSSNPNTKLPAELLILNRYGIGYPYLKAAWELSQKHHLEPSAILIKAKVITLEIWLDAQRHLDEERRKAFVRREQEAFLLNQSVHNLNHTLPHYSAKTTFTNWQIVVVVT